MNVTIEKNGNVNAVITVSLEEKDYQDKVTKDLKTIGLKHRIDGFRPGKVPAGILKKMFGKQVLADVVNRETVDALFNFIKENNLSVLGEPLAEESQEVDLSQKEYTFKFEVGLAPEFNVELNKDVKVPYYTIAVDDAMVQRQTEAYARRFGSQVPGEKVDETALVKGSVVELNEDGSVKEGGHTTNTILSMEYLKGTVEGAKFLDKVVGDKVVFNPKAASKGSVTEIATMLNVEKSEAENIESNFELTISEIIVLKLAEMNQEFFDNVFGKEAGVSNGEEFKAKMKEMIASQLVLDSNYRFTIDAQKVIMAQVGEMELPVEFLKKWLKKTNEKINDENVDDEFNRMRPAAEWQLVKEKIAKNLEVKVGEDDLKNEAKLLAAQQFAQYGMTNVPDELIEKYSKDFLENKEYRQHLVEKAVEDKLFAAIKEAVSLEEKTVSVEEFNDLFKA